MIIKYVKNLLWGIPVIFLWGFFFFQISDQVNLSDRIIFACLYALSIITAVIIIQKLLIKKLRVFSNPVQTLLKSFFYAASVFIGYLVIFLIEIFFRLSSQEIITEVGFGIFKSIVALFTLPVSNVEYGHFFPQETISVISSLFILLVLVAIVGIGLSFVDTRWLEYNTKAQLQDARLKLLEMQMKPHFLFNSMNSIVTIIKTDPDKAQNLLIRLSDFLRYNFNMGDHSFVKLMRELEFIENYLELNKARFGSNLSWCIKCSDNLKEIPIPAMILQPIVENALNHGWEREKDQIKININCSRFDRYVDISITDNGRGISFQHYPVFPPKGHALYYIKERLGIHYQNNNLMLIESKPGRGTKVTLKIPEKI